MEGGLTDISTSLNGSFVSNDYRAGAYIFGMVRDRDAYDRNDDGFSEIPTTNSETIGFRAYYKTSAYSKLTAEYHHIREFRRGGDNLDLPPHEAEIAEKTRHGINGGGLRFDLFSKDYRHKLNLYSSFQGIRRRSYYGAGKDPNAYGRTIDNTFVAGAQYAYSFRKLLFLPSQLTMGVEFNNTNLIDHMTGYDRHIKQLSQTIGGYVQKPDGMIIGRGRTIDCASGINCILATAGVLQFKPGEYFGNTAWWRSGGHLGKLAPGVTATKVHSGPTVDVSQLSCGDVILYDRNRDMNNHFL
jgi:outer membrane receptor for ferrienterochelin and colicins